MEWFLVAIGAVIGYGIVKNRLGKNRLESRDDEEYEDGREEYREDRTYRYDAESGEYRENRSAAAGFTRSASGTAARMPGKWTRLSGPGRGPWTACGKRRQSWIPPGTGASMISSAAG